MKRVLCLVLAVCLLSMALSGCGDKGENSSSEVSSQAPSSTPVSSAPVQMAKAVKITADGGLNVRDSASTDGEILGVADSGDLLPLLVEDEKDGWYQVQYGGKGAYVSAEYVEVKEITLEEYNRLKNGGDTSSVNSSAVSSEASSQKSGDGASSKAPVSSSPDSSSQGNTEDGE